MTATIDTPTIRTATRRSLFWIIAAIFAIAVALATLALTGASQTAATPYSATEAGPTGSKALAQVLAQHGVAVTVTDSLVRTRSALLKSDGEATMMLVDPNDYLDADQVRSLAGLAKHVVLLTPTFAQLADLAPEIAQAGAVSEKKPLKAGCSFTPARNAGTVGGGGFAYRLIDTSLDATTCFGSGHSAYSLIDLDRAGRRITVVGTTAAFTNAHAAEFGNAALALNLLGDNAHLVWYLPTINDRAIAGTPTIAQLTPPWVSPVIVLLIITGIAAAVWRGRRMGPIVVENLPVTVRASETMEGRARLYQKGSARLRAIDSLRIGAVARLASTCGLSRLATVDEVISAVASLTGSDEGAIRNLLLDDVPRTDRALVALSDSLLELERRTAESVRPQKAE